MADDPGQQPTGDAMAPPAPADPAAVRPAEATGDAERVATRHRLREIILGWSGMDESDLGPIVDAIMREVVVPVEQARDAAEAHTHAAHGEVARLTAEQALTAERSEP